MRSTRAQTALAALAGIALHLLLLALLPPAVSPPNARTEQASSTIDFTVGDPSQEQRSQPAQLASADTHETERVTRAPRTEKPISETASAVPAGHPEPSAPSAEAPTAVPAGHPEPSAPSAEAPTPADPAQTIDLSPRAAALASLPPAAAAPTDVAGDLAALRSAQLSAELGKAATADVAALVKKRKLELSRDADGTCHYAGDAIDATILPDGGVQFADKAARVEPSGGVPEPPARPFTMEDREAPQMLYAGVKITPRAWQAERDWFLRESEPIRRELADATHARELKTDARDLRKQLDHIWCDESRPKPDRRRAIFDLWADTSSDEIGARGRTLILDYIRRNLPAGSADAFTGAELAQLNLDRSRSERFDPYLAAGDRDEGSR